MISTPLIVALFTFLEVLVFVKCCNQKPEFSNSEVALVDRWIKSHKVVIISRTFNPHYKTAKDIFDKLNQKYFTVELDKMRNANYAKRIQAALQSKTGTENLPYVFVKGKYIESIHDCLRMYGTGELSRLLTAPEDTSDEF